MPVSSKTVICVDVGLQVPNFSGFHLDASDHFPYHLFSYKEGRMGVLKILQLVAVGGTFLTGLYSLVRPRAIQGFTGLVPEGGRGVTEIRSIVGGDLWRGADSL